MTIKPQGVAVSEPPLDEGLPCHMTQLFVLHNCRIRKNLSMQCNLSQKVGTTSLLSVLTPSTVSPIHAFLLMMLLTTAFMWNEILPIRNKDALSELAREPTSQFGSMNARLSMTTLMSLCQLTSTTPNNPLHSWLISTVWSKK
jgi:hypothetical protein